MENQAPVTAKVGYALGVLRICLGLIFLWAFLDKAFGLDHTTASKDSWLNGGSPTRGYLGSSFGPFEGMFKAMAGEPLVDFLFMAGLLGVGVAMVLGIAVRIGAWAGAAMMLMMYLSHPLFAAEPNGTHPFLDDHIVYAVAFVLLGWAHAGRYLGLGLWWERQPLVRKHPVLT